MNGVQSKHQQKDLKENLEETHSACIAFSSSNCHKALMYEQNNEFQKLFYKFYDRKITTTFFSSRGLMLAQLNDTF